MLFKGGGRKTDENEIQCGGGEKNRSNCDSKGKTDQIEIQTNQKARSDLDSNSSDSLINLKFKQVRKSDQIWDYKRSNR